MDQKDFIDARHSHAVQWGKVGSPKGVADDSSTIRITLENSSSVPVDFVKLSFEDSASRIALAVLNEGEVSREQAYELEYDMIKRPVFVWSPEGEVGIPPGGRTTISVTCLGKVGW